MTTPSRNAPCSCGSGRRYKECHGKLGSDDGALDGRIRLALTAHRAGRIDEAERGYRDILARDPANAVATHYLGLIDWQRGDVARAEERMRAALAADATIPDFHNNLGLLLRDSRRAEESIACFRAALAVNPAWYEAANNLGLALEAAGRGEEAIAAYRDAIAREPRFAAARQNLARELLARGAFAEGWREYRWRLFAQGLAPVAPDANAAPLPIDLTGRKLVLVSEQGLGDALFFLRFARELSSRGAALAFRGDARLHGMLERTGLFALGLGVDAEPSPGLEPIPIGDLPFLLDAIDPEKAAPPLALTPRPENVKRMRADLAACGPPPYRAATWRAGVASTGPSPTQLKEIGVDALGRALTGTAGTWISVQRLPRAGETEALANSIGAPVHDFSACNDDLEDMLALLSLLGSYVGVSNANTYLAGGVGTPMKALVAHPPEWRWRSEGRQSPWFPAVELFRQDADGDWSEALRSLRAALT